MTPRQLATEIRVAHEGRDHTTHAKALELLLACAEPCAVDLTKLDRHQLEARRNELHVRLAAVNDRMTAAGFTRNCDLAGMTGAAFVFQDDGIALPPLEPSDPSA